MSELTRRNPPDRRGRRPGGPVLDEEADFLRSHPGESYLIQAFPLDRAPAARAMGVAIRQGRYAAFQPAGAFGARSATENGKVNVYAWFGELNENHCEECGYRRDSDGHRNSHADAG
jgi:hypothetical protein